MILIIIFMMTLKIKFNNLKIFFIFTIMKKHRNYKQIL